MIKTEFDRFIATFLFEESVTVITMY